MPCDRRRYLALVTGAIAGSAGCLGDTGPADRTDTPTETATPTGTDAVASATPTEVSTPSGTEGDPETGTATANETDGSPTATAVDGTLVLQSVAPEPGPSHRVYPSDLRNTLRTAAEQDGPVRTSGAAHVYVPVPVLPGIDTVELVDPDGEAGGTYAVDCRGGTRYELLVGVEEATPPEDATVTPVDDLSGQRRDLAVAAIENRGPRVYPETELGEWVRTEFFDEYVSHEGTTYRGREAQQTDAAFFSTAVWYVIELTPTDESADAVTLDLSPVDPSVRVTIETLLDDRSKDHGTTRGDGGRIYPSLRSFLDETDRILTHTAALALDVE